eukprot:86871_1
MSQREILTINIGECGVRLGHAVWEQYCMEHEMNEFGSKKYIKKGPTKRVNYRYKSQTDASFNHSISCFFEEVSNGQYTPRNLMIDTAPNIIDDVQTGRYKNLLDAEFLLSGNEDAASIFSRGHNTIGREIIHDINDKMRKLVNHCDLIQGFCINHSVGGGTGSGLGALILERLSVDYPKKTKIGFEVYPSHTMSSCVVQPYNALLSTQSLLEHIQVSVMLDNEMIYEICQKSLDLRRPSYDNLNWLINKSISCITSPLRFDHEPGDMLRYDNSTWTPHLEATYSDLDELETNLVPFPRLHFMVTSLAPIARPSCEGNARDVGRYFSAWARDADSCFSAQNFFTKIADFDAEEDKYMVIMINYKGFGLRVKEAIAVSQWLKTNKKVSFVEWCPTGFKIGIEQKSLRVDYQRDNIYPRKRSISMLGNNTAIGRVFSERICKKYDLMYSQRAFVHWYIGDGMEHDELLEAREDLGFLEQDYLDILSEEITDDDEKSDSL